jgi:cytochrome c-type biogenesis protein CcmH
VRVALVLLALLALAPPALAKPANFADVEDEVMCVSCNVALNVAESPQADAERRYIRQLIARGEDKAQIKAALVRVYGENVLALPKSEGINWAAYLVPIALIAVLAVALAGGMRRWRRREPPDGAARPATAELSDADAARLDADLALFDR